MAQVCHLSSYYGEDSYWSSRSKAVNRAWLIYCENAGPEDAVVKAGIDLFDQMITEGVTEFNISEVAVNCDSL